MKLLIALTLALLAACTRSEKQADIPPPAATQPPVTQSTEGTATLAPAPVGVEPVAGPKLTPSDEGPADPTFVAYRDKLRAAVKNRDAKSVVALADPKIRTSFGDGGGAAELETMLARPGVWEKLDTVLSHGGSFLGDDHRAFWAPYVYSAWPDERDAFKYVAVLGENVPLRKAADANAEALATLSYDIVERTAPPHESAWVAIKTSDGRTGFVEANQIHSPVGYRAGFIKQNGAWTMNALVAGD